MSNGLDEFINIYKPICNSGAQGVELGQPRLTRRNDAGDGGFMP